MAFIVDGKLTIPLYHGTSDLFYESIRQFGLGGRNLIMEFRVIELLRELISVCRRSLPNREQWPVKMQVAESIAQQCVSRGGFNFRHGSTYLTPSSYAAANYATSGEYGSEALEQFMLLWNRLRQSGIGLPQQISDGARPIINFALKPKMPIMIKVDGISATVLRAEKGGDPASVFLWLESFMNDPISILDVGQQANFEVRQPIRIGEADVFRIVDHSRYRVKEPRLAPYFRRLCQPRDTTPE
jgi:hypothetical protein